MPSNSWRIGKKFQENPVSPVKLKVIPRIVKRCTKRASYNAILYLYNTILHPDDCWFKVLVAKLVYYCTLFSSDIQ
jgi:hypothetical protein